MEFQSKEEFENTPLRGRFWPMPEEDVLEIEKQVEELIASKLVEPYPAGSYPKYCTPTFLSQRKTPLQKAWSKLCQAK